MERGRGMEEVWRVSEFIWHKRKMMNARIGWHRLKWPQMRIENKTQPVEQQQQNKKHVKKSRVNCFSIYLTMWNDGRWYVFFVCVCVLFTASREMY